MTKGAEDEDGLLDLPLPPVLALDLTCVFFFLPGEADEEGVERGMSGVSGQIRSTAMARAEPATENQMMSSLNHSHSLIHATRLATRRARAKARQGKAEQGK